MGTTRFFNTIVKPDINCGAATGTAFATGDILFTWTPFEIPRGTACLKSLNVFITGTDGADGNAHDIHLYFAKSLNGVAPTTLGTLHAAPTAAAMNFSRPNIIGYKFIDQSEVTDGGLLLTSNFWRSKPFDTDMILQGDQRYDSTSGYQTLWIGAITSGAFNFATDVQLNQVGNQAASVAEVSLTVEQGDAGTGSAFNAFAVGDKLVGATGGPTMEVTEVTGATVIKAKNISEQIDNDEELIMLNPIHFHMGFEY